MYIVECGDADKHDHSNHIHAHRSFVHLSYSRVATLVVTFLFLKK